MKKVTAVMGTETKKATFKAMQEFERNLKLKEEIDFEYLFLNDYDLKFCKGCKVCFNIGEERCPLRDDRDILIEKLTESDGVIFATPNYAFGPSARMKNLLDRMAFIMHRPRFFKPAFTAVVTQGIYKGGTIRKYLEFAAENLGFRVTKGCVLTTLDPLTDEQQKQLVKKIRHVADNFYTSLCKPSAPPSLYRLALFRIARTSIARLNDEFLDHRYYRDNGWFESDYYYPVSLGIFKKACGSIFDFMGRTVLKIG